MWVKKCMDFVVECVRPIDVDQRERKEVVEGYMKSLKLSKEDDVVNEDD